MQTNTEIEYRIKTATEEEIYQHLTKCNDEFVPPLDSKIAVNEYAGKIFKHAVTFEAWSGSILAGLIAAYFNNPETKAGFITNVSVLPGFNGKGIASFLVNMSVDYALQNNYSEILLEVNNKNSKAINLYTKFEFFKTGEKYEMVQMKKIISHNNS